jgi:hypothetical protein
MQKPDEPVGLSNVQHSGVWYPNVKFLTLCIGFAGNVTKMPRHFVGLTTTGT